MRSWDNIWGWFSWGWISFRTWDLIGRYSRESTCERNLKLYGHCTKWAMKMPKMKSLKSLKLTNLWRRVLQINSVSNTVTNLITLSIITLSTFRFRAKCWSGIDRSLRLHCPVSDHHWSRRNRLSYFFKMIKSTIRKAKRNYSNYRFFAKVGKESKGLCPTPTS